MVCISDGRANVPLSVSNGEPVSAWLTAISGDFTVWCVKRFGRGAPHAVDVGYDGAQWDAFYYLFSVRKDVLTERPCTY